MSKAIKILLIEDDVNLADNVVGFLQDFADINAVTDGLDGEFEAQEAPYDLIISDLMLPGETGLELIKNLRANDVETPVLILTAKTSLDDKIEGFNVGADDYLTKPFQANILIARIEAHLRRYHKHFKGILKYLDIKMDLTKHEVYVGENKINLTKVEYDLLQMFLNNKEEVLSRQELLMNIWNFNYDGDTRLVDIHVFKLKSKLKESQACFKSVRGVGYKLVKRYE